MSRHAHEQSLHRWTPQKAKPHGMEAQIRAVLFFGNWRTCMLKWQCQEGWPAGCLEVPSGGQGTLPHGAASAAPNSRFERLKS